MVMRPPDAAHGVEPAPMHHPRPPDLDVVRDVARALPQRRLAQQRRLRAAAAASHGVADHGCCGHGGGSSARRTPAHPTA